MRQRYPLVFALAVCIALVTLPACADTIAWTVTRPSHVNIDLVVMRPRAQAAQHKVCRDS